MREAARGVGASGDHDRRPKRRVQPRTATQAVVKQKPVSAEERESSARRDAAAGAREVTVPAGAGARREPCRVVLNRIQRPIKCDVCPAASYTSTMGMVKAVET